MSQVARFILDTIDAISTLVKAGKWLQALVVLYSAIDTLAWSTRSGGDVTRSDFCDWVSAHMAPSNQLGCTAEDLYAARCGLLHSGASESRLSREGKATELWYATSSDRVAWLQKFASKKGLSVKVLGITELVEAFADGARQFVEDLGADRQREEQVNDRVRRWLGFVPSASLEKDGS